MIVGLTGGIATGKSTVSDMFRDVGAYVVDADIWARKIVEPGQPALDEIFQAFGAGVLHLDGTLNRPVLGKIVFHDDRARDRLNAITHPRVRQGMKAETQGFFAVHPDEPIIWDVPLLFEGATLRHVDTTVLVYVDETLQLKRLMARDHLPQREAMARIRAQMPIEEKRKLADYVIDNAGSKEQTKEQVQAVWQTLRAKTGQGGSRS